MRKAKSVSLCDPLEQWDDDGGAMSTGWLWRGRETPMDIYTLERWEDDGGAIILEAADEAEEIETEWNPVAEQDATDTRYDSVADFLAVLRRGKCRHPAPINQFWFERYVKTGRMREDWLGAGCITGSDVQRMITEGWPWGIARARELLDDLDTQNLIPFDRRRRQQRGDYGDSLDIAAVYRGHHNTAWTRAARRHSIAPQHVTIVANLIIPRELPPDCLFWRGAAAMCLSDLLETSGYSVRLVAGYGGRPYDLDKKQHGVESLRVTIKDHGAPLDISTATAVLLPGFSRAMCLGWDVMMRNYEMTEHKDRWNTLVGQVILDEGDIAASHEVIDRTSALAWLTTALEKINVEEGQ